MENINKLLDIWCEIPFFKQELENISKDEIYDRFYKNLDFGTGGMRAVMGAGTNRINLITITKATAGISKYMIDNNLKKAIIAYDVRNNSKLFATQTAKVFEYFGIKCFLFENPVPSPQLSYSIKQYGCDIGIVITASHNPKEYNGYKVYNNFGCQLTDNASLNVINYVNNIANEFEIFKKVDELDELSAEIIDNTDNFLSMQLDTDNGIHKSHGSDIKIVYTPLHGTGSIPCTQILQKLGYNPILVSSQLDWDGNFTNCASPNPEDLSAMQMGIETAKKNNADLILATDPDCDRIAVVCKHNNNYIPLSGNQIGYLILDYLISVKPAKKDMFAVSTIVTSDCTKGLLLENNIKSIKTLTGFKYIGDKINDNFFFGYEESVGYLANTNMRDKDAVGACMIIAVMSDLYKKNNITLYDRLQSLYEKYGFYQECQLSYKLDGIDGIEKITKIIDNFKKTPMQNVISHKDYTTGIDDLPKSNVQKFFWDNAWCVLRPSGTEPKLKVYISAWGNLAESTIENIKNQLTARIK